MSRAESWQRFDQETTLRLVVSDLDKQEERFDRLEARLAKINTTLVGILISLATGAMLLAVNIVVEVSQ